MLGLVAVEGADAFGREEVAHRRVDALVGALHVEAALLEQRRERRHRGAADANQVDAFIDRLSRDGGLLNDEPPAAPATTRARTPSGSVSAAPVVWPDGKPNDDRAGEVGEQAATCRRRDRPPGSSQPGSSPNTIAADAREDAASRSCVQQPIEPVRPLADVLEEQDGRPAASNAYGVPSEAASCVSVPPSSRPRASPARATSSPAARARPPARAT